MSAHASLDRTPGSVNRTPTLATTRGSTIALTVFRLAGLFTFLTVTMGAVVSATKSGAACPTWPGCRPGIITPPLEMNPVIEFTHRVVAMSTGPLILAAAVVARRLARPDRWMRVAPWVALAGAIASAAFGRLVVLNGIPAYLGAIDLFCALAAMTIMGTAAVFAARPARAEVPHAAGTGSRVTGPRAARVTQTAATGVGVLIVMHAMGILTASRGSYTSSMGWPLWLIIAGDLHPWLQVVRMVLAGLAAALVAATAVLAMRTRLRLWGVAIASVLVTEAMLGAIIRTNGLHTWVAVAHSALAVALLCGLGVLTALSASLKVDPGTPPPLRRLP